MRKLKSLLTVALLLSALSISAVPTAAQSGPGDTWDSPSLPVSTSVDVTETTQIHVSAVNASGNLTVTVSDSTGTQVASTTLMSGNDSAWLDPGPGDGYTVEVSGETTGVTVDTLSVAVEVRNGTGETWSSPDLPVSTVVAPNATEEVRVSAVNASSNLTVTVTNATGGEVLTTTLVAPDDVVWLDPGNESYTVSINGSVDATVENLSVEVAENAPAGGGGGLPEPTSPPVLAAALVALLAVGAGLAHRRD